MSTAWWAAMVVGPFLALVVLLGVVAVVALCRARQEDIPTVLTLITRGFSQLTQRMPSPPRLPADADQTDTDTMIPSEMSSKTERSGLA